MIVIRSGKGDSGLSPPSQKNLAYQIRCHKRGENVQGPDRLTALTDEGRKTQAGRVPHNANILPPELRYEAQRRMDPSEEKTDVWQGGTVANTAQTNYLKIAKGAAESKNPSFFCMLLAVDGQQQKTTRPPENSNFAKPLTRNSESKPKPCLLISATCISRTRILGASASKQPSVGTANRRQPPSVSQQQQTTRLQVPLLAAHTYAILC